MSKKQFNRLQRQHKTWEQTQEKRRRLLRKSAATTMATALIAAKLMTPASAAEINQSYSNDLTPQNEIAMLEDDNTDETTDEMVDETTDETLDTISDEINDNTDETADDTTDEFTDENTDGISDYSMYDFSDEYSDEISDEFDTDERIFEIKDDGTNLTLLRVGKDFYFVNDERARLDAPPVIEEGRTILPVRFVAQAMGAEVQWDEFDKRVTITKGKDKIELWIDSNLARVNGDFKLIDPDNDSIKAKIHSNRTMVPVRFVAETLGSDVFWDELTKTISVKY